MKSTRKHLTSGALLRWQGSDHQNMLVAFALFALANFGLDKC